MSSVSPNSNFSDEEDRDLIQHMEESSEKMLEKLEKKVNNLGEELSKVEHIEEDVLKHDESEELNQLIENDKKEEKDLQQALKDVKSAKSEIDDIVNKVTSDEVLMTFLGFSQQFDTNPSSQTMDRIEASIKKKTEGEIGVSKLKKIGKEAKNLRKEVIDVSEKLNQADNLLEEAVQLARKHHDYSNRNAGLNEIERQMKMIKDIHNKIIDLNNRTEEGDIYNLEAFELELEWVSNIVTQDFNESI